MVDKINRRGLGLETGIIVAIVVVTLILVTFVSYAVFQEISTEEESIGEVIIEDGSIGGGTELPLCNDGIDNDGDGDIDLEDYGCQNHNDDSEINNGNTECSDGVDNDSDGDVDQRDFNCVDPSDDSEGVIIDSGNETSELSELLNIDLVSPEDEEYISDDPVVFTYIPNNVSLDVCELWGDFNGIFMINQSDTSPNGNQENTFSLSLNDGEYNWGIYCRSTSGDEVFTSNRTAFIDLINPNLVLNGPLNDTYTESSVQFNYTVSDANLIDCSISYVGSTFGDVVQNNCNGEMIYDLTGLVGGDYFMKVIANDSAGNLNSSNVSFSVDFSCGFSNAVWNTTTAEEGELVLLSVDGGAGCENSDLVNYTVYRVVVGGEDLLVNQTDEVPFVNNVGSLEWAVATVGTQEDYYFNASLNNDGSISLESNLLTATPPGFFPGGPEGSPFGVSPPGEGSTSGKGWILLFLILGLVVFIIVIVTLIVRNIRRVEDYE